MQYTGLDCLCCFYFNLKSPLKLYEWSLEKPRNVKNVQSLGWEDLQEKGMATLSSILAWEIRWIEELVSLQSMGWQRTLSL